MKTREEAAAYGLTFPDSYEDRPFKDQRWQVIRVKPGKKIFLWIYEKDELIHLNVKTDPRWRDFWRAAYPAVIRDIIRIKSIGIQLFWMDLFRTRILNG